MARYRSHSIEFKRQVAQEYLAGETLHGLAKRHDICRNLIRVWVAKYEAGGFGEDAAAADLIPAFEARIAALERLSASLTSLRGIDAERHRWSASRPSSSSF
jgi:transposase